MILVFILSAFWWIRIRGLWKLPDGRDWLWGNLVLVLIGDAMLSLSLVQFSVGEWGCVPFLLFGLRANNGRGNSDNGNFLQKDLCLNCCIQCPWLCSRPLLTDASSRDSWTHTCKSGSVSYGGTAPFSWILVDTRCYLCPSRVSFSSPVEVL